MNHSTANRQVTRHARSPRAPKAIRARSALRALSAACLLAMAGGVGAQPQPKLPVVQLQAGIHLIRAEVADDYQERMMGLMQRPRLGPNEGMLFVFEQPSGQCFWMKNTIIPLSIAFIADDGGIVNIADMKPLDESSHCSERPVRFALEMDQGWFVRHGLKPGSKLEGSPFAGAAAKR